MIKIFAKTLLYFICMIGSAYASNTKFYLGFDASLQDIDIDTKKITVISSSGNPTGETKSFDTYYRTKSINPAVFLGLDIAKFLKIEASYSAGLNTRKDKDVGFFYDIAGIKLYPDFVKNSLKHQTISLDFKPYLQLKAIDEKLFVFAILGVSYNKINISEQAQLLGIKIVDTKQTIYKTVPVVGFGAEYLIIPNLALRTQLKYTYFNQRTDPIKSRYIQKINSITNLNFGVAYYF